MQRLPLRREREGESVGGWKTWLFIGTSAHARRGTCDRDNNGSMCLIVAELPDGPIVARWGWPWRLPDCQQEASGKV